MSGTRMLRRAWAGLALAAMFAYDLVMASLTVARIVVSPRRSYAPAIMIIPVDARTAWGTALFATLVSMTPGSTTLHVAADKRSLYVHFLDVPDPAARVALMKRMYESRILRLEGEERRA